MGPIPSKPKKGKGRELENFHKTLAKINGFLKKRIIIQERMDLLRGKKRIKNWVAISKGSFKLRSNNKKNNN